MEINETTLEMHFHAALIELIKEAFGLGVAGGFNFYKYSPQQECFVGFDQAFVKTQDSAGALFKRLKQSAKDDDYKLPTAFVGYFLQFKCVSKLVRYNKRTSPPNPPIKATPFYRSKISNQRTPSSPKSQHELLFELCKNNGAMVYYACPMLFSKVDLYSSPNLSSLRLVDLETAPSDFRDNEQHFILFPDPNGDPHWCSEPVRGEAISPGAFAELLIMRARRPAESAAAIVRSMEWLGQVRGPDAPRKFDEVGHFIADTLTILEVPRESLG